jgi:glycosyltransferase involved in cell wall biosynthesis
MSLKTGIPGCPRAFHIVENLDRGAVENWLVRMLRRAQTRGLAVDWTFYCALGRPGQMDATVLELGGRIIYSPFPIGQKVDFIKALRTELRRGRYDILHCHHDLVSGLYLAAAFGISLKQRLVHVHNADEAVLTPSALKQAVLRLLLRQTCLRLADRIVGISNHTLDAFLAGRPRCPKRDRVHYYGIDPAPFLATHPDPRGFRQALALPKDALILLFAGRMVPEKNPLFVLDVLCAMRRHNPRVVAVFVGAGSMEKPLADRAAELGVMEAIRLLGWRSDVAAIMSSCDWFILPRPEQPMEGLGIAVIEAQLAGLRLLLSRGIADDPLLPGSVWARLALADGPERWAEEALRLLPQTPPTPQMAAAQLAKSPFDMDFALTDLLNLYSEDGALVR